MNLKLVSESHLTWATPVPILVFPGLYVLELGPMYATGRCQMESRKARRITTAPPGDWWNKAKKLKVYKLFTHYTFSWWAFNDTAVVYFRANVYGVRCWYTDTLQSFIEYITYLGIPLIT